MRTRTKVRAGGPSLNHNQTLVHTNVGMPVKTRIDAGLIIVVCRS